VNSVDSVSGQNGLYCNHKGVPGRGVALETTLESLEASVAAHDLVVSPIKYRYYDDVDRQCFNDELDQFFHKRKGFQHENELRLLRMDERHYRQITAPDPCAHYYIPEPAAGGLPDHLFLTWDPTVIERIIIGPYADDAYETEVKDTLESAGFKKRIESSILDPRRYRPRY
jgi:hypothetical protein